MHRITPSPDAFNTIVRGGLMAGVLDALDAVVAYGINMTNSKYQALTAVLVHNSSSRIPHADALSCSAAPDRRVVTPW
jgi:hypothetical protein